MAFYWELFLTYFKIGLFSFGGGYAMIPLMQEEAVNIHSWLAAHQMTDIVALSQMLPGALAVNMSAFVGFRTGGMPTALFAVTGVVLPSFCIVLLISKFYDQFQKMDVFQRFFQGVRPAVVALIGGAGLLMAKSALIDLKTILIGLAAFGLLYTNKVHPVLVMLGAGLVGIWFFT